MSAVEQSTMWRRLGHRALKAYLRHFPLQKGKERVLNSLWRPLSKGNFERRTQLRHFDAQITCDLTKWIQRHIYFYGEYEPVVCGEWMRHSRSARVVFDIGANVGIYTLIAASVNPRANIYAFEPTKAAFDRLCANIAANGFKNVASRQIAVSEESTTIFLNNCHGSGGDNEGMNYTSSSRHHESDVAIECVALDDFCVGKGISKIDLLKMDVEGSEYRVLKGATRMLAAGALARIFLELNDWASERAGSSRQAILELLNQHGYSLWSVTGRPVTVEDVKLPETLMAVAPTLT